MQPPFCSFIIGEGFSPICSIVCSIARKFNDFQGQQRTLTDINTAILNVFCDFFAMNVDFFVLTQIIYHELNHQ